MTSPPVPPQAIEAAAEVLTSLVLNGRPTSTGDAPMDAAVAKMMLEAAVPYLAAAEYRQDAAYVLGVKDGAGAERERIRYLLIGCTECGEIHDRRQVAPTPENPGGTTVRHPRDGHAYAPGYLRGQGVTWTERIAALLREAQP